MTGETMTAFGCVGSTIRLESGRYFDLLSPNPDDVLLSDIAGALSRICRFGGHVRTFYSVAEHSYLCAAQARLDGLSVDYRRAALMHDAAEAYVGDLVKPLKMLCPDYQRVEGIVERAVRERFGLTNAASVWQAIKAIDQGMLISERRTLFSADGVQWTGEADARRVDVAPGGLSPKRAYRVFMDESERLGIA